MHQIFEIYAKNPNLQDTSRPGAPKRFPHYPAFAEDLPKISKRLDKIKLKVYTKYYLEL